MKGGRHLAKKAEENSVSDKQNGKNSKENGYPKHLSILYVGGCEKVEKFRYHAHSIINSYINQLATPTTPTRDRDRETSINQS